METIKPFIMKLLSTLTLILVLGFSFAQEGASSELKPVESRKAAVLKKPAMARAEAIPADALNSKSNSIFGTYHVAKYSVLGLATPSPEVIEKLVGSEVTVSDNGIEGPQLKLDPFDIVAKEEMARGDYIYEAFGRSIRAPEPNLPNLVKVLRTNGADLYGIVDLSDDRLAIPYRGLLLILEQDK